MIAMPERKQKYPITLPSAHDRELARESRRQLAGLEIKLRAQQRKIQLRYLAHSDSDVAPLQSGAVDPGRHGCSRRGLGAKRPSVMMCRNALHALGQHLNGR
jgi:hypothetical protein